MGRDCAAAVARAQRGARSASRTLPSARKGGEMKGMTRRRFLQYGIGAGAALTLPWAGRARPASAAVGGKLTKYMEPVPLPGAGIVVATPSGLHAYSFTLREISRT